MSVALGMDSIPKCTKCKKRLNTKDEEYKCLGCKELFCRKCFNSFQNIENVGKLCDMCISYYFIKNNFDLPTIS